MKKHYLAAGVFLVLLILAGFGLREFLRDRAAILQTPNKNIASPTLPIRAMNPAAAAPIGNNAVSKSLFHRPDLWWQQPIAEEPFARFHDWVERYIAAPLADKATLEADGIYLSKERRQALAA